MKKQMLGLLAVSVLSSSAMAQNGYIGADFSLISAELSSPRIRETLESDPTALRLRAGAQLNKNFAVEGVLGLGLQDDEIGGYDNTEFELDSLYGVNAVGILPLDRTFELFGKIGFAALEYQDGDSDGYDDTGIMFGFGGKINFDRNGSGLIVEYTILPDTENTEWNIDVESEMLSIGAQFSF